MKAVIVNEFGDEKILRLSHLSDPSPRYGDILVKVKACGVCYHDILSRKGLMKGMDLPRVIGHEVAGIVEEIGLGVKEFKKGDSVALIQHASVCGDCDMCRTGHETLCRHKKFMGHECNGGYAEKVVVSASCAVPIPENVPFDQAAITACAIGTELNAIRDVGKVQIGENVLITGAGGGLGVHGIQIASAAGAKVIAVTTSREKADKLRQYGADEVVVTDRGGKFSHNVRKVTNGKGADVVIDNVGGKVFHEVRKSLSTLGRWVMVGEVSGGLVQMNLAQLFLRGFSLQSATSTTRKQLREALQLVSKGKIRPVIGMREPLHRAENLHIQLEQGKIFGRSVLIL